MANQIGTKAALLAAVADGKAHSSWEFSAGTLGWAKRERLVEAGSTVAPVMYTITVRGRTVAGALSVCTRVTDKLVAETIAAAREQEKRLAASMGGDQ